MPFRRCGGNHADVHGISYGSRQTQAWFSGVLHNHFYLCREVLWARKFSPSACFVVLHTLYSLFRYMFPLKLLRQREMRKLLIQQWRESGKTFRKVAPLEVRLPEAETIPWKVKFSALHESEEKAK
ncbi:MAG: hypothetical protein Q4D62_08215 [Planctomycetia bacterium]|nr:hypothetical protein [Planctomycetia bacterium]